MWQSDLHYISIISLNVIKKNIDRNRGRITTNNTAKAIPDDAKRENPERKVAVIPTKKDETTKQGIRIFKSPDACAFLFILD